jgi:hypothetical protein
MSQASKIFRTAKIFACRWCSLRVRVGICIEYRLVRPRQRPPRTRRSLDSARKCDLTASRSAARRLHVPAPEPRPPPPRGPRDGFEMEIARGIGRNSVLNKVLRLPTITSGGSRESNYVTQRVLHGVAGGDPRGIEHGEPCRSPDTHRRPGSRPVCPRRPVWPGSVRVLAGGADVVQTSRVSPPLGGAERSFRRRGPR